MHKHMENTVVLGRQDFPALLAALQADGHRLIGPTVRDQAIVYDEIHAVGDLPAGWEDAQDAGRYRLRRRGDAALFAYTVGPQTWKRYLQPPAVRLWTACLTERDLTFEDAAEPAPRLALIGVRPCELAAIAIQDRVLLGSDCHDTDYARRRRQVFIVTVQCARAGNTCFCTSMGTGPRADAGFDLAVTELLDADRHEFVVEAGSAAGAALLARLPTRPATPTDWQAALAATRHASTQAGRQLDTTGIRDLLYHNAEHPRWDDVAGRCLACANCTQVCPTCFCTRVEDRADIAGRTSERVRYWDSCFNSGFSYIHGGIIRSGTRARYRQWLTHKLASWHDQFGSSGCVGCGRCITWCPVGIDLTAEVAALRATATRQEQGAT
ncbi:MAG: 4Fe-4S dicluster domain-containing protein [Pseudomonadota bacterium]